MRNRLPVGVRIMLAASCYFVIRTIMIHQEIKRVVDQGLVLRTKTANLENRYKSDLKLYERYFGREH